MNKKIKCRFIPCFSFRRVVVLSILLYTHCTAIGQQTHSKPNVILIMADDLGWGDVGFNGNQIIKTPYLDKMAGEGMRFNRFYCASPLCSPTRGSVLTGRHPYRYGILAAHTGGMRQGEVTIAEALKSEKYQTGFFGKWHLGHIDPEEPGTRGVYSPPRHHGFDETFCTSGAVPTWNPTVTPKGFNKWGQKGGEPWKGGTAYRKNGVVVTENLEGDDSRIIMDRVIPFIEKASVEPNPFLAVVWFHTPHEPAVTGPKYRAMYKDCSKEAQHYYGCITAMDEQIGRLRNKLDELGLAENTMIWFTSDNGPSDGVTKRGIASAGPFRGHKHTVWEGGLRVPSLLVWPGKIEDGVAVDAMCGTTDYFPTLMDMLDIDNATKDKRPMDGLSMLPFIEGKLNQRPNAFGAGWLRLFKGIDGKAIIENKYKLLKLAESNEFQLFDLENDPGENNNIAEQYPQIVKRMKKELKKWETSCQQSRDGNDYSY